MNGVKPINFQYICKSSTAEIFHSPEIARCVGVGGSHSHTFLAADGDNQCVNCWKTVYSTCYIKEEQVIYWLPYFAEHSHGLPIKSTSSCVFAGLCNVWQ